MRAYGIEYTNKDLKKPITRPYFQRRITKIRGMYNR
jgi:hypothetical protein